MIDDEALGADAGYRQEHQPLSAKSYPIWIIGFGLIVLSAFGYSSLSLPNHVSQARTLARADRLDQAGDYVRAESEYRNLLAGDPGSEAGRLGMAHAMFADRDQKNDVIGLALLQGMRLDKYDWRKLQGVMPEEYQKLFVEQEER